MRFAVPLVLVTNSLEPVCFEGISLGRGRGKASSGHKTDEKMRRTAAAGPPTTTSASSYSFKQKVDFEIQRVILSMNNIFKNSLINISSF